MSSLHQDEADKQLRQAVPWPSDPQVRQQRDLETRRLQDDVIEAAKRLGREFGTFQPPVKASGFHLVHLRKRGDEESRLDRMDSDEKARQLWAQLRSELVSAPYERRGLGRLALAAGFAAAMVVSAVVAMVVVKVVHSPGTLAANVSSEERVAKGDSLAAALSDLAKISDVQAKMTHADEPAVGPAETLLASAQPDDIAVPKSPAMTAAKAATSEPSRPEMARPEMTAPAASPAPAASAPPVASPAPEKRRPPPMSQDEAAALLKRGRDLIAAGDIASARLMLTLVAEAGDAEASFALAGTYDPAVLAKLPAIGAPGDPAKARAWYARAAELGSQEARQRLQALR